MHSSLQIPAPSTPKGQAVHRQPSTVIVAALAAVATYTCMYAFRKPFTAASFEGYNLVGVDFKVWLVTAQVFGYMLSKFYGIRFIAELKSAGRLRSILALMGFAWLSLLGFALVPPPRNIVFLFLNGLPLGLIWGIVFSYLEGRRTTEFLGAVLASSFIFASGFVKSAGVWVMNSTGASEFWMPFVTGALFVLPLAGAAFLLEKIPPPDDLDRSLRSERTPMSRPERRAFLKKFLPGIVVLVAAYLLLTVLRDLRDNFAAEIWTELGYGGSAAVFTSTELPATFVVLGLMTTLVFVKNNFKALLINHLFILVGLLTALVSTWLFLENQLSAPLWMTLLGIGLYLGYVPFNCLLFDRLIAAYRQPGNVGFIMYVADAIGYLGSVAVLLVKEFFTLDVSWSGFLAQAGLWVGAAGLGLTGISAGYFLKKSKITQERLA